MVKQYVCPKTAVNSKIYFKTDYKVSIIWTYEQDMKFILYVNKSYSLDYYLLSGEKSVLSSIFYIPSAIPITFDEYHILSKIRVRKLQVNKTQTNKQTTKFY